MADRRTRLTRATQAGLAWDQQHHAVVPPIYLSPTYALPKPG